jgi:hypothetical protein
MINTLFTNYKPKDFLPQALMTLADLAIRYIPATETFSLIICVDLVRT